MPNLVPGRSRAEYCGVKVTETGMVKPKKRVLRAVMTCARLVVPRWNKHARLKEEIDCDSRDKSHRQARQKSSHRASHARYS